jgi:hypothetical protein
LTNRLRDRRATLGNGAAFTINLPENHTITTARHVSDGGHGGTSVGDPHGAHPAHPRSDINQSASFKFPDDGSAHPAHATGKDTSVQSTPADNGHHAIADPEINLASIAPNHLPQHPADNSLHVTTQLDDNGVLTVTDGAHPADSC